jgi:hypothetical protein
MAAPVRRGMIYVVFDDALQGNKRGWTPDRFAESLRDPLAAIGVRVLRQDGQGWAPSRPGFQASGYAACAYEAKLDEVEDIVDNILKCGPA